MILLTGKMVTDFIKIQETIQADSGYLFSADYPVLAKDACLNRVML